MEVQFIGEHLIPGNLGHFLTILSMTAAFVAAFSFIASGIHRERLKEGNQSVDSWNKLGKIAFYTHGLSVLGIIIILFWLISVHYWEYQYVWQHSSLDLPWYYRISCFWEGQEGSFLLWTFWNMVLGMIVLHRRDYWSPYVMGVIAMVQVFLAMMLIGIYVFDYKLGSSPFILMRDHQLGAPIFSRANYLSMIKDGNGLNPLLQNYWMVIHPPTLFLGFAATLIPFAYSLAGIWTRNFDRQWSNIVLRWCLLGAGVLGIGILMGGAWAYEALSFGGFWAWDPVENASLMPWIMLIAGLHCVLAYKHSGHTLPIALILLFTSFILTLYSTFLTRSGILGTTSVHSFTDLGMSGQLLVFLFFFIGLATFSIFKGYKNIPTKVKEEQASSREFWLFVGSLIITIYGIVLVWDTSWPVINKITTLSWFKHIPLLNHYVDNKTTIIDPITHYNQRSIWFAIVISILIGAVQYLKYKDTKGSKYWPSFIKPLALALLLSVAWTTIAPMPIFDKFHLGSEDGFAFYFISPYFMMLFAGFVAVCANIGYLIEGLKGKIGLAGSSIAHVGFGLVMIGALLSNFHKEVISINTTGLDFGESFDEKNKRENVFLPKGQDIQMSEYWVKYESDTLIGVDQYFNIKFEEKKTLTDPAKTSFVLSPKAQNNPKMGLLSNPDRKVFWNKDIFTYVSSIADNKQNDTTEVLSQKELKIGDTLTTKKAFVILKSLSPHPTNPLLPIRPNLISIAAQLEIISVEGKKYYAEPIYYIDGNYEKNIPAEVEQLAMNLKFEKLNTENNSIKLSAVEIMTPQQFVILKAIKFPMINLLWLGCIIMGIGFVISIMRRRKEYRIIADGLPESS